MTDTGDHVTNPGEHVTEVGGPEAKQNDLKPDGRPATKGEESPHPPVKADITVAVGLASEGVAPQEVKGTLMRVGGIPAGPAEPENGSTVVAEARETEVTKPPPSLSADVPPPPPPATLPNSLPSRRTARDKFKVCENCRLEIQDRIRVCSACKRVAYCNNDCQKGHWKTHKLTCSYYLKKDVTG